MTQTVAVSIPAAIWLTSNHRHHWAEKAKRVRMVRAHTTLAMIDAELRRIERATVTAWVGYPHDRRQDPTNAEPTCKAIIDAIIGTGRLLPDDDATHLTAVTFRRDTPTGLKGWYRIRLTFEEHS